MRGLATAALLIAIALACLVVSRKLEHERRLTAKLRRASSGVPLSELSEREREAAESLATAGVLVLREGRCHIRSNEVPVFRRKRIRLAVSGALGALVLAIVVAVLILRR